MLLEPLIECICSSRCIYPVYTCCLMPIPEYNTVSRIHLPNQCTLVHGSYICIHYVLYIHFLSTCFDNICSKRETIRKGKIKIQNCFNPQRNCWDRNLYSIRCFVFQFQVYVHNMNIREFNYVYSFFFELPYMYRHRCVTCMWDQQLFPWGGSIIRGLLLECKGCIFSCTGKRGTGNV